MRLAPAFVCVVTAACCWTAEPPAAAIDTILLGNAASELEHRVAVVGKADTAQLATTVGTLRRSDPVRILAGEGSSLALTLAAGGGSTPLLLEIQEIHDRRPQVFGYTVAVNGVEVYFRTYEEVGAGPNHFFVEVPRKLAPDGVLNLMLRNHGEAPVAIGRVWAYGNFAQLAQADGTWRPMGMLAEAQTLIGWVGKPGKQATFDEERNMPKDRDPAAWTELRASFSAGSALAPGFQTTCNYLSRNGAALKEEIDEAIRKAGTNSILWQYKFMGGDWGGHPSLLDGKGGDFYDIRYSQAVYDPLKKQYGPTWPSTPGGTIWPTAGEATLNRFIMDRSRLTARMLSERIGLLAAQGVRPADVCLVGDEGPSYWWQNGFGDFSPDLVAAAAHNGVTLDPEQLNPAARRWMFDNLTARYSERCQAIAEGLGRDVIAVDHGVVALPATQLADAVYSHPFMNQVFPLFDRRWEGWQNGANEHAWVGGEPLEYVNPSFADYIACQGSLAMVNLFRPILDVPYLEKLYQWGMGHIACYQEFSGDAKIFSQALAGVDARTSQPVRHYLRKLVDLEFSRMATLAVDGLIPDSDNLVLSPTMAKTIHLMDPTKPGLLVVLLDGMNKPLPEGLTLHLDFGNGPTKDKLASGVAIAVGADIEGLQQIAQVPSSQFSRTSYWPRQCTAVIPLGTALQGASQGYVAIELTTADGSIETGLRSVSVQSAWTLQSGQLVGGLPTNREMRIRRLWLQDRAVTERLLARHRAAGGAATTLAEAEGLLASGKPRKARKLLSGAHSLLLPARFAVRGRGPLGPYPITVAWKDAAATALVELRQTGKDGSELVIQADANIEAEIRCGGLTPGKRFTLTVQEGGLVRLAADPAGALVADASGWATATCTVAVRPTIGGDGFLATNTGRVPSRVLIALSSDKDRYEVQDPALALFNPLHITSAATVVLERRRDGEADAPVKKGPSTGDRVEITLDEAGRAIGLRSTYGEASGTIRTFTPPAVHPAPCNGIIELEDGRRFEIMYRMGGFTKFTIPGLKPFARNNSIDDYVAAIKPGMTVRLTYSPPLIDGVLSRLITVTTDPATKP